MPDPLAVFFAWYGEWRWVTCGEKCAWISAVGSMARQWPVTGPWRVEGASSRHFSRLPWMLGHLLTGCRNRRHFAGSCAVFTFVCEYGIGGEEKLALRWCSDETGSIYWIFWKYVIYSLYLHDIIGADNFPGYARYKYFDNKILPDQFQSNARLEGKYVV